MENLWKVSLVVILVFLVIPMASAFEFDNVRDYDIGKREVTVTNAFGLGREIAKVKLDTPDEVFVIRGKDRLVAEFTINNKELYTGDVFTDMDFYNKNNYDRKTAREFKYKYKEFYDVDIPKYKEVCADINSGLNGTYNSCNPIQDGTETIQRFNWVELDTKKDFPAGNTTIGIFTDVEAGESIEWIPELFGVSVPEWAFWTESMNAGLMAYYTFETGAGGDPDGTLCEDVANGQNNGTYMGATTAETVDCIQGNCFKLAEWNNDTVQLYSVGFNTSTISLGFWVKRNSTVAAENLYFSSQSMIISGTNGYLNWVRDGVGNDVGINANTVTDGEWHHVVLIRGGTTDNNIYIDGVAQSLNHNNSANDETTAGNRTIGARPQSLDALDINGTMDEMGIWNRALTAQEVTDLYNGGAGILFNYTGPVPNVNPSVTLNIPTNSYNISSTNITFNCSSEDANGINNLTLVLDDTNNYTISNSSDFQNLSLLYNVEGLTEGSHNWSCLATDGLNLTGNSSTRNYTIDSIPPLINITYPFGTIDTFIISTNLTLNWTTSDTNPNNCWWEYGGENVSVSACSLNTTTFNVTSQKNITFWVNDSIGNQNSSYSSWDYKILVNSQTYNVSAYETGIETLSINASSDGSETVSANLIYDGTSYTGTKTGDNSEMTFSKSIDTPLGTGNKSFFWNFLYGTESINTSVRNVTIRDANLSICTAFSPGDAGAVSYLNFTFKDETNDTLLDVKVELADFDFWLGSGTTTKNLIFTNTSENYNYSYCFIPSDNSFTTDLLFKYSKTGYPQRTFAYDDEILSNTTAEAVLYLLGSADGIYSSIAVASITGAVIPGVLIQVEREIGGVWTLISQGSTDSSGLVTFWVNPNFVHRITATKTGYTNVQVSITPSQSLYTITMSTGEGEAAYNSSIEGLKWIAYPGSGTLEPQTNQPFNATVTATAGVVELEDCKFELINASNISQVISSATGIINSTYCHLDITYTTTADGNLFGKLSVDTDKTDGFVVLNADWKWILIDIDTKAWRGIPGFFGELRDLSEWGTGNEAEFSRFMFFFLIVTIFIAVFTFFSGVELTSPGGSIVLIWVLVVIASAAGFLTIESGGELTSGFMEQYAFAFITTMYFIGFMLNKYRQTMN